MHILLITTYFEPDSGAAAVRLSRLARLLHTRGHQITVLTAVPHYPQGRIRDGYRGRFSLVEERDGMRVIHVWLWATPSDKISRRLISQNSLMMTLALRGLAIPRPDVVLIEAQPVFSGLAGAVLSRLKRVPYVMNISDLWPEYLVAVGVMTETNPIYRLFRQLVNFTERGASGLVALHPPILTGVERRIGPTKNSRVIYNAVDLDRFRPGLDVTAFRQKYDLGEARLVTFVGTFGTHIDIGTMLDAAAHFNDRQDVLFVFIGTGVQRELLQKRIETGELPNTRWIGWVDYAEMPLVWGSSYITFWALHNHDIYRSTLQAKTYEALASGTPVAIATEGITSEMITRAGAGITVPFGDTPALIGAIDRLLTDTEYHQQCSRAARAYAEANLDPEVVAAAYESVLVGAVNGAR